VTRSRPSVWPANYHFARRTGSDDPAARRRSSSMAFR
jgi:hypothetical protein